MAYRIKLNEPFGKAVPRIAGEQIELAVRRLGDTSEPDVAVHEARKHLKRIRALLRLARPALGEEVFARENARFREIGLCLAYTRDLDVLAQTICLIETSDEAPIRTAAAKVKASLVADRQKAQANGEIGSASKIKAMLGKSKTAVARIKLSRGRFKLIELGLQKTYQSSQKRFKQAFAAPSDAAFHEWRKTVQQHWRHMVLLSRAWPEEMTARRAAARELSEILGQDHDLALLKRYLETASDLRLSRKERDSMMRRCEALQADLRARARSRGERLLCETASDFCARIEFYWQAAREMKDAETEESAPQRHTAVAACKAETGERKAK